MLNPLNVALFHQAATSVAHFPTTTGTVYHFDPETSDFTPTDDSSSSIYTPSSTSSQSGPTFTEPYDRSDSSSSDSETTTTVQEESTSTKYDDSFGGHGDRYEPQREVNYYELRGYEQRVSKARQDYPYPLQEDTQFIPAESSPQEYYYTYEHARALPPPFGYNIGY